jgi:hypothetical protein
MDPTGPATKALKIASHKLYARVAVTLSFLVAGIACILLGETHLAAGLIGAAIGHAPSGAWNNGASAG